MLTANTRHSFSDILAIWRFSSAPASTSVASFWVASIDQVRAVIASASIYVAFPFLAGTRISEQLGLCWDCVDFDAGAVHIKRVQDKRTGKLIETTKTASGQRILPMSETLCRMLAEWKPTCPSLERVFPAAQGGVLLYSSFLHRFWRPALQRMGLPSISIHSARASFISMLQASGVDVATAAKLAGSQNAECHPPYYTHSLHDGREALNALEAAYSDGDGECSAGPCAPNGVSE